eukprot:scaffold73864_cov63-Phaeocystis_antarctica.AAC.5
MSVGSGGPSVRGRGSTCSDRAAESVCGRRPAVPRLASLFIWGMCCSCLVAPSAAACLDITEDVAEENYKQDQAGTSPIGKVSDNDNCIDIGTGVNSFDKKAFFKMGFPMTVNVCYSGAAGSLSVGTMAFKMTAIVMNMECSPSTGCGSGCTFRTLTGMNADASSVTTTTACNGAFTCGG